MCLGIPGKIVAITRVGTEERLGEVSFGGIVKTIHLAFTPEAEVGDYVLAHAGVSISVVDEKQAKESLAVLAQLDFAT